MTVSDMILKLAIRLNSAAVVPSETGLDSVNESVRYLALKLADRNSDLGKGNYSRITSKQSSALPADFNGFVGAPTIDDKPLDPLPADLTLVPPSGPKPLYYEVIDSTIYLYPPPVASITITAKYWPLPDSLLVPADPVPYEGKFDSLLLSMAAKFSVSGYAVLSQQAFIVEVEQGLDTVLMPRKPALPVRRPLHTF